MKQKLLLKRLKIYELFGTYNVDIKIDSNINIFVGENGLGKTTILNILNYIIQGDAESLSNVDFKTIEVTLGNNEVIKIGESNVINRGKTLISRNRRVRYYNDELDYMERKIELEILKKYPENLLEENKDEILNELHTKYRLEVSPVFIDNIYEELMSDNKLKETIKKSWEYKIYEYMKSWGDIIYLPTYRRIEEDFNNYIENMSEKEYMRSERKIRQLKYMQFGMDDVKKSIEKTCNSLRNNTNEGFKGMTSNLLTKFIEIVENNNTNNNVGKIDSSKLEIVFSRLTDEIKPKVKEKIISMVDGFDFENKEYNQFILSIVAELTNLYEKNKEIDENLENFKEVCNKYLVNKKVEYDKFKIECNVIQEKSRKVIDLKNLSSGEKQILSLFSKLYLNCKNNSIILFDEPELSLSILWQSHLIPDIIDSNKCGFICAVTHSPFIFDNKYELNTIDIKEYITVLEKKDEL